MPYEIITPFQNASPGVFPAQNNENFQRLRDIINNDHFFTDSVDVNAQGIHKQMTMINRADPGALPAGGGILYSKLDGNGVAQVNWYNGASIVQITPGIQNIEGSSLITFPVAGVIFPDPGYSYQANCWLLATSTGRQRVMSAFLIQPGLSGIRNGVLDVSNDAAGAAFTLSTADNILRIAKSAAGAETYKWSIQISRLS